MHPIIEFFLGSTAACGACVFSNPFEVVKTRMQLQGELRARGSYAVHYKNVFHASYNIVMHDGITALQKGLAPALIYQAVMNGSRLGSYQMFTNLGLTKDSEGKTVFFKCLVAGALSGGIGAFMASPAYMVKTRLQAQSARAIAVGHQHEHIGVFRAWHDIYHSYGITGLWQGASGVVLRISCGSAVQLSSFSKSKEYIAKLNIFPENSWLIPASASMVSGLAVVLVATPFDVICTRLYNQGTTASGKSFLYTGITDCILKILKNEGVHGLYKGLGPHYFRMGPHTFFSLLFWDELRKFYRCNFEQPSVSAV